jgi:pyridoxal phosphate enzyme (YggS family)
VRPRGVIVSTPGEALASLRSRVRAACARAGRAADEVTLLGVAKRIPSESVLAAVCAGLADVAENYVQEAAARRSELAKRIAESSAAPPRWHFIGRLQRNKTRAVAQLFDTVHTLDRPELGDALERATAAAGRTLDALIQVNASGEAQKGGVAPDSLHELLAAGAAWPHLRIRGLMAIPAASDDPERTRPAFAMLRALRDALRADHPALAELSMGMSSDFEVAIEEGATIIRVGTALFGARE